MARQPPKRPTSKATANQRTTASRSGRIVREEHKTDVVDVTVEPGSAQMGVTHGAKFWASDATTGMTVETTCHVSLSCKQHIEDMVSANDEASQLAFDLMIKNGDKMRKYLEEFFK